jgi:hypothetical protein
MVRDRMGMAAAFGGRSGNLAAEEEEVPVIMFSFKDRRREHTILGLMSVYECRTYSCLVWRGAQKVWTVQPSTLFVLRGFIILAWIWLTVHTWFFSAVPFVASPSLLWCLTGRLEERKREKPFPLMGAGAGICACLPARRKAENSVWV